MISALTSTILQSSDVAYPDGAAEGHESRSGAVAAAAVRSEGLAARTITSQLVCSISTHAVCSGECWTSEVASRNSKSKLQ